MNQHLSSGFLKNESKRSETTCTINAHGTNVINPYGRLTHAAKHQRRSPWSTWGNSQSLCTCSSLSAEQLLLHPTWWERDISRLVMKEEEVLKEQTLQDEWNPSIQTFLYLWGKPKECLRLCVLECTYYFLMTMGLTFKWLHFISQLFYFIHCDQVSDESHFIKKTTQEKAATVHAHIKKNIFKWNQKRWFLLHLNFALPS